MYGNNIFGKHHCVKRVRIRSYSGPYFPAFGLNMERYSVSLRIHSECGKIQTIITPNTDTFYAVHITHPNSLCSFATSLLWLCIVELSNTF